MKNKKERISLSERLCHTFDIQPDVFPRQTFIELRGQNSVTLHGCGRVIVYTDTLICVECREGRVSVKGLRLCCSAYKRGTAVIDGYITAVEFEKNSGERADKNDT